MARKVFFSFHYKPDNARASQIRNMGVVEGNQPVKDNDWETVKKGGDDAIAKWINGQLDGKSCSVVLIGTETAGRKWITYEIIESWNKGKGLFGIYIHNLKDLNGEQTYKGNNPFNGIALGQGKGKSLSEFIKIYDPPYSDSKQVYNYISSNIEAWVEAAVKQREA